MQLPTAEFLFGLLEVFWFLCQIMTFLLWKMKYTQVHLLNYIQGKTWTENPGFEVRRNLIRFTADGHDICVDYSGDLASFIDVMVKSSKSHGEPLQFLEFHIIQPIVKFCASPRGCQGVLLTQTIIRSDDLHWCLDKKPC